jgi:hypothetical protein
MSYRARIQIPVDKQHACATCRCVFRYTAQVTICGVGSRQEAAMANLQRTVPRHLEQLRQNPDLVVEKHPCPGCGHYPPEMNLQTRWFHVGLLLATCILSLAAFGAAADTGPKRVSLIGLAWFDIVAFAVVAAGHLIAVCIDPNRDPPANQRRALREVSAGAVQVVTPGKPVAPHAPANLSVGQLTALLLVLMAPLSFFSALSYRAFGPGIYDNPGCIRPEVLGPGEEFSCLLPGLDVQGVGQWRGRPTVRVLNAKETGIYTIAARGNDQVWGDELKVYTPRGSRVQNSTLTPLVYLKLPDDPNLGGQELHLQVNMNMTYAVLVDFGQFVDCTTPVTSRFPVRVAPPGYADGLHSAYLVGLVGAAFSLVGGLGLTVASVRWKGQPSQIFLPQPEAVSV